MAEEEYGTTKAKKRTEFLRRRHPLSFSERKRGTFTLWNSFYGKEHSYDATDANLKIILAAYDIHVTSAEELITLANVDHEAELDVMAHVAAYFVISSRRLIDDIPRLLETVFARAFGEHLSETLITNLNLVGETGVDNCRKFVRDEPQIQEERERLTRILGILEKAKETIDRFFR